MDVFKSHLAGRRDAVSAVHVRRGSAGGGAEEQRDGGASHTSSAIDSQSICRTPRPGAYLPTDLTSRSILTAFEQKKTFSCAVGVSCSTRSRCRS